jgi:DnaJ-class molecular chaperone
MPRYEGKPSDAAAEGICPMCLGDGEMVMLVPPPEHTEPCPMCHGSKTWPPTDAEGNEVPAG